MAFGGRSGGSLADFHGGKAKGDPPKVLVGPENKSPYTEAMSPYVIRNPVPTPEQMAEILGISSERVTAVREIMGVPSARRAALKTVTRRSITDHTTKPPRKSGQATAKRKGARGESAAH